MGNHHEEPTPFESALTKILEKEEELEAAINKANNEAKHILKEANATAEEIIKAAREEEQRAKLAADAAKDSAKKKTAEVSKWEIDEAEKVKKTIAANFPKAVKKVIELALPA